MTGVADEIFGERKSVLAGFSTSRGQVIFYEAKGGYSWRIADGPYKSRGFRRTDGPLETDTDRILGYLMSSEFDSIMRSAHPERFGE